MPPENIRLTKSKYQKIEEKLKLLSEKNRLKVDIVITVLKDVLKYDPSK